MIGFLFIFFKSSWFYVSFKYILYNKYIRYLNEGK